MSQAFDVCIVGAGLVGLSVGRAISARLPGASIVILDKEGEVGAHQSGHNSGVVHSGLYYRPGSLKARLCVQGREEVYRLCEDAGLPGRRTGKVVIATTEAEIPALDELQRRGEANGLLGLRRLGPGELGEVEPGARGLSALLVPDAGVADFPAVARHVAERLVADGARIDVGSEVVSIDSGVDSIQVATHAGSYSARLLVNCAGLHSDRVATLGGVRSSVRIVPFRGEYYRLSHEAAPLVKSLIYPVPDPRFPFLGVHFTRRVDGEVEVGPNAILALGREHYRGARPNFSDLWDSISYEGFWRLAGRHWAAGIKELMSSRSRGLYARLARRLVPEVRAQDLLKGGAGVRAQAVDRRGRLVDDFVIESGERAIHVLNAPSPGATASLAIGRHIAELAASRIGG